jgi:hypothetical protein
MARYARVGRGDARSSLITGSAGCVAGTSSGPLTRGEADNAGEIGIRCGVGLEVEGIAELHVFG